MCLIAFMRQRAAVVSEAVHISLQTYVVSPCQKKTTKLGLHDPGQWGSKLCSTVLDWNISGIACASDWNMLSCVCKHTVHQEEWCLLLLDAAVHRIWPSNSHFSLSCLNMTIRAGRSWSVISRPLSHIVRMSLCVHLRTEVDTEYRYRVDVASCIVMLLHAMPHYTDTTAVAKVSAVCSKTLTHIHIQYTHACTHTSLNVFGKSVIKNIHNGSQSLTVCAYLHANIFMLK